MPGPIPLTNSTIKFAMKQYYQNPVLRYDGAIKINNA
jgi:hypothetical protein